MNILDDAFGLAKAAYGVADHAEAKNNLQKKYPKVKWEDIEQAYLKAFELVDACYDYGDRGRDKKLADIQALIEMQKRFPGFSESTYRAALSHGYFISR